MSYAQRQAAARYARLARDAETGLMCCWVCGRPMDPVLYENGFASHPCCDPAEIHPSPLERNTPRPVR